MRRNQSKMTNPPTRNSGFTLIELVVVILVIAILVAMIMPAMSGARNAARNAQVVADIKNLEAAIANFKLKFGREPPSSIVLFERASDWNAYRTSTATDELSLLAKNSIATIREIWPDFDFGYTASAGISVTPDTDFATLGELDINGNGTIDATPIRLNGAECLAFFLGGVCATMDNNSPPNMIVEVNGATGTPQAPKQWAPLGFSTNPRMPFKRGGNRVGPFVEFAPERLVGGTQVNTENGVMPAYLDTLPNQTLPYLYLSSNNGRGYNKTGSDNDSFNRDAAPLEFKTYFRPGTKLAHNQKTYQIISPGPDGEYGIGGEYESGKQMKSEQARDRDNITNFSSGPLSP